MKKIMKFFAVMGMIAVSALCNAQQNEVSYPSGLIMKTIREGNGIIPKPTDVVTVHYKGTLKDGTIFDSSYKRNEPTKFPLNQVIPCWTEGVGKMKVGTKAVLTCPSKIAYGDRGIPGVIPPAATLIFEVELLAVGQ